MASRGEGDFGLKPADHRVAHLNSEEHTKTRFQHLLGPETTSCRDIVQNQRSLGKSTQWSVGATAIVPALRPSVKRSRTRDTTPVWAPCASFSGSSRKRMGGEMELASATPSQSFEWAPSNTFVNKRGVVERI